MTRIVHSSRGNYKANASDKCSALAEMGRTGISAEHAYYYLVLEYLNSVLLRVKSHREIKSISVFVLNLFASALPLQRKRP